MATKKAKYFIGFGILLIGYNIFKIFHRMSKPSLVLKDKNIFFKSGFLVGSYGLLILGIFIILFTLLSIRRKQLVSEDLNK